MIDPALKTKLFMARARSQALNQVRLNVPLNVASSELDEAVAFLGQKIYKAAMEQQGIEEEVQAEVAKAHAVQEKARQMAASGDADGKGLKLVQDE